MLYTLIRSDMYWGSKIKYSWTQKQKGVLLETKINIEKSNQIEPHFTDIRSQNMVKVVNRSTYYYCYWNKMEEDSDYDSVESEPVSMCFYLLSSAILKLLERDNSIIKQCLSTDRAIMDALNVTALIWSIIHYIEGLSPNKTLIKLTLMKC